MKGTLLVTLLAASSIALAQGPGPGPGPGYGPGAGPKGGPRMGAGVTPGWALMTPAERTAHQDRMRAMKDPAECEAYMAEHHKLMEQRAEEKSQSLRWNGPRPYCEYLRRKPA